MPKKFPMWTWAAAFLVCAAWVHGQETTMKDRWTNRLAKAHSPYLLQHAHNPVDWFPWGAEAFERARSENKPIFLSIGYSTCHSCHVMERESFENPELAAALNTNFVSIKVDREERPDVDAVYMSYVQAATGSGGWPMSVWLTPDLKPFMGGTYFPPDQFKALLERITTVWETERESVIKTGDAILEQLRELAHVQGSAEGSVDASLLDKAFGHVRSEYDSRRGGFGGAPKFPRPSVMNFLFRYHARTTNEAALEMSLHTLRQMARGGIHDQLGGGFHRYSTDGRWHLPHFEKMLYDQAQLASAYLDAFQITRQDEFSKVARDTLDYVLRDLTGAQGQFYSAEDADSPLPGKPEEKAEGAFYVWEQGEIEEVIGASLAERFSYHYGVRAEGNVQQDPRQEFPRKNVLSAEHIIAETAEKFGQSQEEITTQLRAARQKLFAVRQKRPRPHLDDKTLTAWNGLMISALARAHQVLDEPRYLAAAERTATFLRERLYRSEPARLLRRYRAGQADIQGFADDYAYLIQGLLDLYEASLRWEWLEWARSLQMVQDELFWDESSGGYFKTVPGDKHILLRLKEDYDGAEPAPSSVAALNLLRLGTMTDHDLWRRRGERTLQAFRERVDQLPGSMPQLLAAAEFRLTPPREIILVGKPGSDELNALFRVVHKPYLPNKVLLGADGGSGQAKLAELIKTVAGMEMLEGKATAYVCQNYHCELPVNDPKKLADALGEKPKP